MMANDMSRIQKRLIAVSNIPGILPPPDLNSSTNHQQNYVKDCMDNFVKRPIVMNK
jgi:septation ring formation regulator EzrA